MPERRWNLLISLGLAAVAGLVFANTLGFQFVHDDWAQIAGSKQIGSWQNIPSFFTGHVWSWKNPGSQGPYYRPIFQLWLLINFSLFDVIPYGWHLSSVCVHVGATVLVYFLALRLTADRPAATIAGLIFAVLPAHLESVAWVSAITDPLATVCFVGAFLCYLRAEERRRAAGRSFLWTGAAALLYALAVFEKEIGLVFPLVVLAYEWLFADETGATGPSAFWKRARAAVAACVPFLQITIVYVVVRLSVLHGVSLVINPLSRLQVILTWPSMLLFYLRHLTWPGALSLFYYLPVVTRQNLQGFILPLIVLLPIVAAAFYFGRHSKPVLFAYVWMLVTLVPVFDIRGFAHNETVHDRYLYLPSVGFCLVAAIAARRVIALLPHRALALASSTFVIVLAAGLAWTTVQQSWQWTDDLALFGHAVEVAPQNEIANQGLGTALFLRRHYADAITYYRRAIDLQPRMAEANYGAGRGYYELNMLSESQPYFMRAIADRPQDPQPYLYLGLARLKQGDLQNAELLIREALRIKGPDDISNYHASLGAVLKQKHDYPAALQQFQAELNENPANGEAMGEISELTALIQPASVK